MTEQEIKEIEYNKTLCAKYPFLIPTNRWTGEVTENYDFHYTELDQMPRGWFNAFGMQMIEELSEALGKYRNTYRITDIKEKYGTLRWYDTGCNKAGYEVIKKYEKLSAVTCIICGEPATMISSGWISPYCETHKPSGKPYAIIVDSQIINDYYEDENEDK